MRGESLHRQQTIARRPVPDTGLGFLFSCLPSPNEAKPRVKHGVTNGNRFALV